MGVKLFDYYIFIDYSEEIIGYMIVEGKGLDELLPRISKFSHYKRMKHKSEYIHSIKRIIERDQILTYLYKLKLRKTSGTPEIFSDILEFVNGHKNCIIFVSVDDNQYAHFARVVRIVDGENTKIVRESVLKKDSLEYKLSLVLDTLLNIERLRLLKKT